jgi:hypothetical protein
MSEQPCAPQRRGTVGRPLADLVRQYYGDRVELRATKRPDASGISWAKAERMLGYRPQRSWRDYLEEDGTARADGSLPAQARSGTAS